MTDRLETVLRLLEDGADLDPDERAWLAAEVRRMRERTTPGGVVTLGIGTETPRVRLLHHNGWRYGDPDK